MREDVQTVKDYIYKLKKYLAARWMSFVERFAILLICYLERHETEEPDVLDDIPNDNPDKESNNYIIKSASVYISDTDKKKIYIDTITYVRS